MATDLSLFRQRVPIELRQLVLKYVSTLLTNENIEEAVALWCRDAIEATLQYGSHISDWETSQVTVMNDLFEDNHHFNENIERWDVSQSSHRDEILVFRRLSIQSAIGEMGSTTSDLVAWNVLRSDSFQSAIE